MPTENTLLLTPKEVQRLLNVSHATFWRLIRDGALTIRKVRRASRVLRSDVDAYVNSLPRG